MRKIIIDVGKKYFSSFMLSILFCLVIGSITSIVFKLDGVSSVLHKASILFIYAWFLIDLIKKIIDFLVFKKKVFHFYDLISYGFVFTLLLISFIVVIGDYYYNASQLPPLTYLNKVLIFNSIVLFIHLMFCSNGTKLPFLTLKYLIFTSSILMIILFLVGFARTWSGIMEWKLLTLNFSNPNIASLVLSVFIIFLFYYILISRVVIERVVFSLVTLLLIILQFLTSCRGGLLAIPCFWVAFFFSKTIKKHYVFATSLLVCLPIILVSLYFIYYFIKSNGTYYIEQSFSSNKSSASRYYVWLEGLLRISYNPFSCSYYASSNGSGVFHYHNSMLDVADSYGILTALLLTFYLIFVLTKQFDEIKNAPISHKSLVISILFSFIVLSFFESFPFYSPNGLGFIALSCVLLFKVPFASCVVEERSCDSNLYSTCDILLINNVYGVGSTGKIVQDINLNLLSKGFKTVVLFGRTSEETFAEDNVFCIESQIEVRFCQLINRVLKTKNFGYHFMTNEIIATIKKLKPKIVHLHGLNDDFVNYTRLLSFLSLNDINTVYTNHSEFMYLGDCGGYSFECSQFLTGCNDCPLKHNKYDKERTRHLFSLKFDLVNSFKTNKFAITSVSPWLYERSCRSLIFKSQRNFMVLNGTRFANYNIIPVNPYKTSKPIVLNVTPSLTNPNKGFEWVIKLSKINKDYMFYVLSLTGDCVDLPDNIVLIKNVRDLQELYNYYYYASVVLLVSKRETYSMPLVESLCAGTRVVGFKSGGPETVAINEYVDFADYGDFDSLNKNLNLAVNSNTNKNVIIDESSLKYSNEQMVSSYVEIYKTFDIKFNTDSLIEIDI